MHERHAMLTFFVVMFRRARKLSVSDAGHARYKVSLSLEAKNHPHKKST